MIENYIKRRSQDTAVYWGTPSLRADGSNAYTDPVEISCLWKDARKLMHTNDGKEVFVQAIVYVSQDLDEQGMLFQGCLSDLTDAQQADPRKVSRAYEISSFEKTPSMYLVGEYNRRALISPKTGRQQR